MQTTHELGINTGITILSEDDICDLTADTIGERITTISKQFGFAIPVTLSLGHVMGPSNTINIGDVKVLLPRYIVERFIETKDATTANSFINSTIIAGNVGRRIKSPNIICMGISY